MEADFMWWMKRGEVWDQPVGSPFYYKIQDEGGNSDSYLGPDLEERAEALGFTLGDRLSEVNGTEVALADGIKVTPDVVLWATGWKRDFHWIDIPIFDETHMPRHTRGITDVPGLYFLGLRYLHTFSSHIILGAPRDAEYLAGQIKERAAH